MQSDKLQREAAKVLEWGKLLEVLASCAQSTVGAEHCRSMRLEQDFTEALLRQQETSDMRAFESRRRSLSTASNFPR